MTSHFVTVLITQYTTKKWVKMAMVWRNAVSRKKKEFIEMKNSGLTLNYVII